MGPRRKVILVLSTFCLISVVGFSIGIFYRPRHQVPPLEVLHGIEPTSLNGATYNPRTKTLRYPRFVYQIQKPFPTVRDMIAKQLPEWRLIQAQTPYCTFTTYARNENDFPPSVVCVAGKYNASRTASEPGTEGDWTTLWVGGAMVEISPAEEFFRRLAGQL